MLKNIFHSLVLIAFSGRIPSKCAVAALFKLCGRRLERRWPFIPKADGKDLNLGFDDLLEFQFARSRKFVALVVGAFDGVTNDPTSQFIEKSKSKAIYIEPQPSPFARLQSRLGGLKNIALLNAAIDEVSGFRDLYCVLPSIDELPAWTEQVASFRREHLLKHEVQAPGLSKHIVALKVPTLSFDDLLDKYNLQSLDILQIDAEGMDAQLLTWFPFHRIKPAILHYETVHMLPDEHQSIQRRLRALGYTVRTSDSPTDDMAILL